MSGTGDGRVAAVDAQVRRDSEGLPFVPAKTLTGLWRDACETVAAAFDEGTGTAWRAWADWLFGSQPPRTGDLTATAHAAPRPAAISFTPATLPSPVRTVLSARPALAAAMVLLRPAVALEEPRPGELETGTAADEALRLEERARGGVTLVARCTVEGAPAGAGTLPDAAELLLRAGAEPLVRLHSGSAAPGGAASSCPAATNRCASCRTMAACSASQDHHRPAARAACPGGRGCTTGRHPVLPGQPRCADTGGSSGPGDRERGGGPALRAGHHADEGGAATGAASRGPGV